MLNQTGTLNITMTLGATSETIEVSGVAATIDTTSAQLQTTYDSRFSRTWASALREVLAPGCLTSRS